MAYRKTDTVEAESDAIDAIDAAIDDAMVARQLAEIKSARRRKIGARVGLVFVALSVLMFIIGVVIHDAEMTKIFYIAGAACLMLAVATWLIRLGGRISPRDDGDRTPISHTLGR